MRLLPAMLLALCAFLPLFPSPGRAQPAAPLAPVWNYDVVARFPHDRAAFTQGLLFDEAGQLWESTGMEGHSQLRSLELPSGKARVRFRLPDREFGEGLALCKRRLFWITWQNGVCHTFGYPGLRPGPAFRYTGEGWGLCPDPAGKLWMSDGSDTLRLRNPSTFAVERSVSVRDGGQPVARLNELEWIKGRIYANVWGTPRIAVIQPASGQVEAWLDLSGLLPPGEAQQADVLNGIAYDPRRDRLLVTGKYWPRMFQIAPRP